MTNVFVSDCITVFRDEPWLADETSPITCPEYLKRRESEERAAARNSATPMARRVHQELARLMRHARTQIEPAPPGSSD